MWADVRLATAWGVVWLLLVATGFALLRRPPAEPGRSPLARLSWPIVVVVALIARLIPALWLPVGAGYDIESFRMVTDALLGGQEIYNAALGRHPYLPFQFLVMGGSAWLSQVTGLPYAPSIKLPSVLADAAIAGLIYYGLKRGGRRQETAVFFGLLYALNPVSLLVTSYHGQFEAVTLLMLVIAWQFWSFGRRYRSSAVALGLAILNKTWPVVLWPVFALRLRDWRSRILYTAIAIGIPVAISLAYYLLFQPDPGLLFRRTLTHRGVAGYWGPGALLAPSAVQLPALQPAMDALVLLRNGLLAAALLFALWQTRHQRALDAILTVILSIFAVTVGFGIQWLVWPVPFALLLREDRWARVYSLAGTLMLAAHLYGLHMYRWLSEWFADPTVEWIVRLSALPVWITVVAWVIQRLRQAGTENRALAAAQDSAVR